MEKNPTYDDLYWKDVKDGLLGVKMDRRPRPATDLDEDEDAQQILSIFFNGSRQGVFEQDPATSN